MKIKLLIDKDDIRMIESSKVSLHDLVEYIDLYFQYRTSPLPLFLKRSFLQSKRSVVTSRGAVTSFDLSCRGWAEGEVTRALCRFSSIPIYCVMGKRLFSSPREWKCS